MLKKVLLTSISILLLLVSTNISSKNPIINSYIVKEGVVPKEVPIAQLIIDKIGVNNYIYDYNSTNNTVEKNVEILRGSYLPNNNNNDSIIFLAAHSGNSSISYFNELDKLNKNDEIILYYKDYKYTYKVNTMYEEKKDGDIEVSKTAHNQLILTTCSPNKSDKQLIVSSNLSNKKKV